MRRLRIAATVAYLAIGGTSIDVARAQDHTPFVPGRLFATDPDGGVVYEIDVDGTVLREFGTGEIVRPAGLAFGPDGLLYVVDWGAHEIAVYDGDGQRVSDFGAQAGLTFPLDLVFGPMGHAYVTGKDDQFDDEIIEIHPSGLLSFHHGLADFVFCLALLPDSSLLATGYVSNALPHLASDGALLRNVGLGSGLSRPAGIAVAPRGSIVVASEDRDSMFTFGLDGSFGAEVAQGIGLSVPQGVTVGPDTSAYVGSGTLDSGGWIVKIDGTSGGPIANASTAPFFEVAFAPYRFKSRIKGTLVPHGGKKIKLVEKNAVLSIMPWSGACMLKLADDPSDAGDLASQTGSAHHVFAGFETLFEDDGKELRFVGHQHPPARMLEGQGSLDLAIRTEVSPSERFVVKSAKGTLVMRTTDGVFTGKIATKKPIGGAP